MKTQKGDKKFENFLKNNKYIQGGLNALGFNKKIALFCLKD